MVDEIWSGWRVKPLEPTETALFGERQRQVNRAAQQLSNERLLLAELNRLVPGAMSGITGLHFSEIALAELEKWLEQQQRFSVRALHQLRHFLRHGLQKGQAQLQWKVNLPPPSILLPATFNPLTPETFAEIQLFRREFVQFQASLNSAWARALNRKPRVKTRLCWGQFIYSAVVLGGLLDQAALLQLPFCKSQIQRFNDQVWIDLFTPEYPTLTQANRGTRRWFIDPASLILLMQLPEPKSELLKDRNKLRQWVFACLFDYLVSLNPQRIRHSSIPAENIPRQSINAQIKQWYSTARCYLQLILPPYLIEHATGQSHSTAWPPQTWERILRKKSRSLSNAPVPPLMGIDDFPQLNSTHLKVVDDQERHAIFNRLKEALNRTQNMPEPTWAAIQNKLSELRNDTLTISPLLGGLLCWIQGRHKTKEIVRSTAYQQLTSIGKELLAQFDDESLPSLEAEDFREVYAEIVERCTAIKTKHNKADLLRRFHHYMEGLLGWPRLDFSFDGGNISTQADANILTEEEFQFLKHHLEEKSVEPLAHAQCILLILGFRCGLRISEAINLRLEDIQYRWMLEATQKTSITLSQIPATLLVRSNRFNRLKTTDSRRLLPLDLLLSPDERALLLQFHQLQRAKVGSYTHDRYLFSLSPSNQIPIPVETLQAPLHALLRQLTGDTSVRFHHLRHSLATHLLQAFTGKNTPLTLPEHWHDDKSSPPDGGALRQLLIHGSSASRKGLFQIAEWIGHIGPSVTLTHYLHNLDCLLQNELENLSFQHRRNGLGVPRQFVNDLEPAVFLPKLLQLTNDNFRQLCSRHGCIMAWLPDRLNINNLAKQNQGWQSCTKISLDACSIKTRTAADFSFEEWVSLISYWRKGYSVGQIERLLYIPKNGLIELENSLITLFQINKTESGDRLVRSSKALSLQNSAKAHLRRIPSTPRSHENDIAKVCFKLLRSLLNEQDHKEVASALRYFVKNFRIIENHVVLKPQEDERISKSAFMCLMQKLASSSIKLQEEPGQQKGKRPAYPKLRLLNSAQNRASFGAYFALLLACMVLVAQTAKNVGWTVLGAIDISDPGQSTKVL